MMTTPQLHNSPQYQLSGGHSLPMPNSSQAPATAPAPNSRALGTTSLVLGLVAFLVAPMVLGFTTAVAASMLFTPSTIAAMASTPDLSFLTPVRIEILWIEIALWVGTLSGIGAIVLGIISAVRRAGRGMGVTGIILGATGLGSACLAFFFGLTIGLMMAGMSMAAI